MNSGELSQFTKHWYLTAGDGDMVVRVFPGMSLGETETGELSLDGGDAMLSLSIGSDESLVVFVIGGGELETEDGESGGKRHLAFESAGEIRLPNNIVRFDKDMLSRAGTGAPLVPSAVWRTVGADKHTPAADNIEEAPLSAAPELNGLDLDGFDLSGPDLDELDLEQLDLEELDRDALDLDVPELNEPELNVPEFNVPELNVPELDVPALDAPKSRALEPNAPERDKPHSKPNITKRLSPQKVPSKPPVTPKQRKSSIIAPASAALVCILIGLGYVGTRTDISPAQPAPVERQTEVVEVSRQTAVKMDAERAATEDAPRVALPGRDQTVAKSKNAAAPIITPATALQKKPVPENTVPDKPVPDKTVAIAIRHSERTVDEPTSTPEVAERAAPKNRVATSKNTRSQPTNPKPVNRREIARAERARAAAEAEARRKQEQAQAQAQAQAAQVRYERDLLAAELALVQGRLTQPAEDNAHTLYKQLVASNPESSEARRGFQAVGAALVNRAFAELAAKRWSDARATLEAAAEAGASLSLTEDLRSEVAYQQRLADAEAGRFAALYPAAELVALNRTMPRLRRYERDEIEKVQIEFTVSVAGSVQDIEVLGGPSQRLERALRQAVTDWRFEPVLSGTRPIPVRTRVGLEIP